MQKVKLKKKAVDSVILLMLRRVVFQLIATIANILLARLLYPADFGIYATLTFIVGLVMVFADIGFAPSIIQKKTEVTVADTQSVFTTQLILVTFIYAGLFVLAPFAVRFWELGAESLVLLRLYGLVLFSLPLRSVSGGLLERELQYKKLVTAELSEEFVLAVTSVCLAFYGFGVASFIYGYILGKTVGAMLFYCFKPFVLGIVIYRNQLVKLLRFGISYQANVFFGLFSGPLVLLYMSKAVGQADLGYFQFAQNLAVAPLAMPELVGRMMFPLVSRLQSDREKLKNFVERIILINTFASVGITVLILVLGKDVIKILYTQKWLPSLPALYLGVLTYQVASLTGVFSMLLLGLGKAKTVRNMSFLWAALTWVLAPPLISRFGFWGMSLTSLIVSLSGFLLVIPARREVSFSVRDNVSASFIAGVLTAVLLFVLDFPVRSFFELVLVSVLGGVIYLSLVALFLRRRFLQEAVMPVIEMVKM